MEKQIYKIPAGYKQTEVGVIPEDWNVSALRALVEFNNGKAHENDISEDGDYIVVNSKFISSEGRIIKYSKKCYSPAKINSVLMVMSDVPNGRAIAKCFIVDRDDQYTVNQRICSLKPKINPKFLFYKVNRNPYYLSFDDGVKQTNLRRDDVLDLLIALPKDDTEQTAIATALSDTDALIESLERLIAKKRAIKQGAMQELLTGKRRFSGFNDEWISNAMGSIARIYQPQTISQSKFSEAGYLVYGANGVVGKYKEYNHEKWQAIITCRGSTCGTVNKTIDKCWITGNAMVINIDDNEAIDKLFFYYLLDAQDFSSCITGTGQPQIVREPLFIYEIKYPKDKNEQVAIAMALADIDGEISSLEKRLAKYRQIKIGMMQQLLTGKIRIYAKQK